MSSSIFFSIFHSKRSFLDKISSSLLSGSNLILVTNQMKKNFLVISSCVVLKTKKEDFRFFIVVLYDISSNTRTHGVRIIQVLKP